MAHQMNGAAAICGLGITEMGRVYRDAEDLAAEAVYLALEDAGLRKSQLDGLLINAGVTNGVNIPLHITLGLRELNVLTFMQGYGSSAGQMIQYASMAVANGLANYICCVFADDPLKEGVRTGDAYAGGARRSAMSGLYPVYGFMGALPMYALGARRHMDLYGTTQDQLGAVAISQRKWAAMNPRASKREPLDINGYNASPWVVEPFHILDCCLVSNGGVAVIVTTPERARDLKQPAVYVRGFAQAHNHDAGLAGNDALIHTPATKAGPRALAMAGVKREEITQCQIYDCYTYTVIATLEDYGFCKKGDGGEFVASGATARGGSLPVNTHGGFLSEGYVHGLNHVAEAVSQLRHAAGARQVPDAELALSTAQPGYVAGSTAALVLRRGD